MRHAPSRRPLLIARPRPLDRHYMYYDVCVPTTPLPRHAPSDHQPHPRALSLDCSVICDPRATLVMMPVIPASTAAAPSSHSLVMMPVIPACCTFLSLSSNDASHTSREQVHRCCTSLSPPALIPNRATHTGTLLASIHYSPFSLIWLGSVATARNGQWTDTPHLSPPSPLIFPLLLPIWLASSSVCLLRHHPLFCQMPRQLRLLHPLLSLLLKAGICSLS